MADYGSTYDATLHFVQLRGDVESSNFDDATANLVLPDNHLERGRLPRTVNTEQSKTRLLWHPKRDAIDRALLPKRLTQIVHHNAVVDRFV
jgi:hypothetical protein